MKAYKITIYRNDIEDNESIQTILEPQILIDSLNSSLFKSIGADSGIDFYFKSKGFEESAYYDYRKYTDNGFCFAEWELVNFGDEKNKLND